MSVLQSNCELSMFRDMVASSYILNDVQEMQFAKHQNNDDEDISVDSLKTVFQTGYAFRGMANEEVNSLVFDGYSFDSLPRAIVGTLYPNVTTIYIKNNKSLRNIESILEQFDRLTWLECTNCPLFGDLSPLVDSFHRLNGLVICDCGLNKVEEPLFASPCLQRLEHLDFSGNKFPSLPESIGALTGLQTMVLTRCPNLRRLPDAVGNLSALDLLALFENDTLSELPSTVGRLGDNCMIPCHFSPMLEKPSICFRGSVPVIRTFFMLQRLRWLRGTVKLMILLRNARLRANDRLYRPGGSGFLACQSHFIEMQQQNQQEEHS